VDKVAPIGLSAARAALASGVLLLPWLAAADSQIQGGVGRSNLRGTAHVDFRIVIPRMLALDLEGVAATGMAAPVSSAAGPAQTVAVFANSRTIALGSTIRTSDESRGGLVLSSAARKAIAQAAVCSPAPSRGAAAGIVCTASMP
jgi:hypothetical protein